MSPCTRFARDVIKRTAKTCCRVALGRKRENMEQAVARASRPCVPFCFSNDAQSRTGETPVPLNAPIEIAPVLVGYVDRSRDMRHFLAWEGAGGIHGKSRNQNGIGSGPGSEFFFLF